METDFETAQRLIGEHGYLEALRLAKQWRDMNAWGTTSYSLHNALVKELEKCATVGRVEA